jgi:hypothetical protein
VIIVTDKEDMPITVKDSRNPEWVDGDVSMLSPDLPIVVDSCNYNPDLESVLAAVPPEQQASSSQATLDDPLPSVPNPHFLRF